MCKTMNELEKVVADYRSLKALKEELEEQLKDAEREIIWTCSNAAQIYPASWYVRKRFYSIYSTG